MKIRPIGTELFHANGQTDGRTVRHYDSNSHFPQFLQKVPNENAASYGHFRLTSSLLPYVLHSMSLST